MAQRQARRLRVVPEGDAAPNKQRKSAAKSVAEAASGGDDRELLVAMRDRLAKAISSADCPPRDLAALTKRLQDVVRDIKAIDAQAAQARSASGDDSDEDDETFDPETI